MVSEMGVQSSPKRVSPGPRPLGAFVLLPTCELTGGEHLKRAHQTIMSLFDKVRDAHGESRRTELLDRLTHEIAFHEIFEDNVYYPFAFEELGEKNPIPNEAASEHAEVRRLLNELHENELAPVKDPAKTDKLVAELKGTIDHHIEEEENALIPAVSKKIDTITDDMIGCEYEQMADIRSFVSQHVNNILNRLPASLAHEVELIRGQSPFFCLTP